MITLFKEYLRKKEREKALGAFLEEAKANLENYYVLFQINRLRFFQLSAWDQVKGSTWPESVVVYVERLSAYNKLLQEYKDFEQWYNGNLENKTQENGRVLHQKKELTQAQFKGLEDIIKAAIAAIEGVC